jgi:anaerobic ribonucleoside-triphosphate reductase activating protein
MNYATIKWTDIANGEGVRVSLFVSGCTHRCKNCFNQIAWDFNYGEVFDENIQNQILKELGSGYISGLSLLGGEPLEPQNQLALYPFIKKVKEQHPEKSIWCYTGFVFDEKTGVLKETHKNTQVTKDLIALFDVLVDGPFIEEQKNIRLKFRGSENQRIIDVQKTLAAGDCVLYME